MNSPNETNAAHSEKQLESVMKYDGMIIQVTRDIVELENGETSVREVVHHNGGAAIIALNDKNEIALVRQYRYALGQELIEIPAGKIEIGEPPLETARRELGEEAACEAKSLVPFGKFIPTCGFCTEIIYLFLATGLTQTQQNLDEDEFVDVFWLPLDKAAAMIETGEIIDGKTIAGILRAKAAKDAEKHHSFSI